MATDRQIAANRRNAQSSTGPRTPEGRARTRYNALQHGLCAESYLIPDDPAGPYSIQDILDHWNDFYQPESPAEALLIREIVICQWRLERAPRHETGLLAKTVDECFHAHWRKDKETGQESNPLCYDSEEDLPGARRKSTRLLGMAWREMCRDGNPLPKLQRYETALSNRMMKALNLLLKLKGNHQPQPLPNQPILETDLESNTSVEPEAALPAAPPPPDPAPAPAPVLPVPPPPQVAQNSAPEPVVDARKAPALPDSPRRKAG